MTIRWKDASLGQLYIIIRDDPMATVADCEAAKEEILRRMQRLKKGRVQYRIREVYPR